MHVEIRLGNKVNVRVVENPEIQLGFFFSSSAGVPMNPDIPISPCMAFLPNVVTHK